MSGGSQDIIEINGKKYDAITGQIIADSAPKVTPVQSAAKPQPSGIFVDGVRKPARHAQASHHHKPTQKSTTLMRTGVKKPAPVSTQTKADKPAVHKSMLGNSHQRVQRAKEIPKSPQVSRHMTMQPPSAVVTKRIEHVPVKPTAPPIEHVVAHAAQQNHKNHTPAHTKRALIEHALASASAHEQPHHPHAKKRHKLAHRLGISARAAAISSSVLAGILLGGFFAIQNVPNLSMRVAAARSGVAASMPGYQPAGFSFKGPIRYESGKVTVSFSSNTDDRNYQVTQQSSNWNSDALLSNYIVAENKQYQTYIDRGRTLYIYDGASATWIDNGIWYQIEGPSNMTADQLIRIASSI